MRSRGVKRAGRWPTRSRARERAAAAGRVAADAGGIRESARWLHRNEEGPSNGALFASGRDGDAYCAPLQNGSTEGETR